MNHPQENSDPEIETGSSPAKLEIPGNGRLAGIDFGTVRIGIALTDPDRILASPHENYTRGDQQQDATYFQKLIDEERIVGFVVGLPIHTDGNESQKSGEAREFGAWLAEVSERPVTYFDERFTSAFAGQILSTGKMSRKQKKKRLDMIAAQILLTAYLESSRSGGQNPTDDLNLAD